MLPPELTGPSLTVLHDLDCEFVLRNERRYPNLDIDFIRQVCYEHPERFNALFPGFDVVSHGAVRSPRSAGWIYDSVRCSDNDDPDHWAWQLQHYRDRGDRTYFVINGMLDNMSWPFPPVIVSSELAQLIGNGEIRGLPYSLVEGHHRLGHMRKMVQLGLMERDWLLEVIELVTLREAEQGHQAERQKVD